MQTRTPYTQDVLFADSFAITQMLVNVQAKNGINVGCCTVDHTHGWILHTLSLEDDLLQDEYVRLVILSMMYWVKVSGKMIFMHKTGKHPQGGME